MKIAAVILVLGVALALALWGAATSFDGAGISLHGWIALGLGTILSLAVGGGLMALVFHSSRHGYDDRIGYDDPD